MQKIKKGQEIELLISSMAYGGRGIAKVDGYTVFVDQCMPDEQVIAKVIRKKKQYAEARLVDLKKTAPQRLQHPCVYFGYCGGCKWQMIPYSQQLEIKKQFVVESFSHIGMTENILVHDTLGSKLVYRYRNKMEYTCSQKKWILPDAFEANNVQSGIGLGMHVPGFYNKVIDIENCFLMPDEGNQIIEFIRQVMKDSGLPVYGLKTHEGFWRFVMVRHAKKNNQWMVNLITTDDLAKYIPQFGQELITRFPNVVAVINNISTNKASIAKGDYEKVLAGENYIVESINQMNFKISANSFFQTNTLGAVDLYNLVKKYAQLTGHETVVDLYSGTGTIAICLSPFAKSIYGIELVESAINDAKFNCTLNGISNCQFIQQDIKNWDPEKGHPIDVMIIDPPRAGMHKDVVKKIIALMPNRIVYVSCNPTTMARDYLLLKENYQMLEIQPIDLFPQTYHIESVALLIAK